MTVNNNVNVQAAAYQQSTNNTFSNDSVMKYAEMEEALSMLNGLLEKGYTISEWYESASNNHIRVPNSMKTKIYNPDTIKVIIKNIKDACDNVVIGEEKELWTMIEGLVDKYKLSNVQELSHKLKEIVHDEDMLEELANKVNAKFPGKISCSDDFKNFFEQLLNNPQPQPVQQQGVFIDPSILLAQNKSLVDQVQKLREQIGSLGVNPVA